MKPLLAIFAHPDDEAFGPSGSLALWSKEREVFLICVTNGDAGLNSSAEKRSLADIRQEELERSAQIIGVKKVFFLGYKDGSLSNSLYHEIAGKIQKIIDQIQPDTLLTFDLLGISGHIDHITVSLICSYLYRENGDIKRLLYYGELAEVVESMRKDYFIYMPAGYQKSEVDKEVDISQVWEIKLQAMRAHQSQSHDGEEIIKNAQKFPQVEYFKQLEK